MPDVISFEDAMKILAQARQSATEANWKPNPSRGDKMPDVYGVQGDPPETAAQANIPNPPGWDDKFHQPDEPTKPTWNNSGIDPGFSAGAPDYGNGWKGRPGYKVAPVDLPTYGPHNPVLSEDQAHLLQLLWMVTGQNANTVGRGRVLQFRPASDDTNFDGSPVSPEEKALRDQHNAQTGVPFFDSPGVALHAGLGAVLDAVGAHGLAGQQYAKAGEQAQPYVDVQQSEANPGNPQRGGGRVVAE